jgi:sirohydrochlorin ferrochelatase
LNILLSHGSPNDVHRHAVEALCARVAQDLNEEVCAAFLGDALPVGANVLPLFLTRGRHLETDVPAMAEAVDVNLITGPAGYPADMAQMALELAVELRQKQRAVMFALYRLAVAESLMAELYERSKKFSLPAIAALHGQCNVASVLRLWQAEEIKEVLIQPVLLFPGHSMDALRETAGKSGLDVSIGPVLSEHPRFAEWLAGKFREAI